MERPILFSAPMVQAILAGRKTMTRRIVKDIMILDCLASANPEIEKNVRNGIFGFEDTIYRFIPGECVQEPSHTKWISFKCPHGRIGDRLWVRETFSSCFEVDIPKGRPVGGFDTKGSPAEPDWKTRFIYKADGPMPNVQWSFVGDSNPVCWQSPIFMPRAASRILLEITDIRIERLQDISEADALAEGIISEDVIVGAHCAGGRHTEKWATRYFYDGGDEEGYECAVDAFAALWDSINGAGSWNENPWVWVVEFKVVEPKARQATKYDWSNVPDWVQWLATDCLGVAGFAVKPSYSSFLQGWTSYGQGGSACLVLTAPDCAFEDSLEQRPVQGGDL